MMRLLTYLFLLLPFFTYGQSTFLEVFKEKWEHQELYFLQCIDLLEEKDLDYKPTADEMTTRDLILHIGGNMKWISSDYLNGPLHTSLYDHKDLNKEQLTLHMKDLFAYTMTTLDNLEPHDLELRTDFFAGEKKLIQLVELMDDHLTHHKGQLTVYMRLCGKKAPRYVGW